jgi:acetyl esterase/lipase
MIVLGGGFAVPPNDGYFTFLSQFVQEMESWGKDFSVFVLTYSLTPHATYPAQIIQAVAALRYILETTNRDPSNVYLGGDSAGGHLTINVLAHLSHPHPAISPLSISSPLGGAIMIAPWTDLRLTFDPAEFPHLLKEPLGDLISPETGSAWAGAYIANAKRDNYTDPSCAPTSWWKDLKVKELLITGGANEVLLPMIEDLVKKIKVRGFWCPKSFFSSPLFSFLSPTPQPLSLFSLNILG